MKSPEQFTHAARTRSFLNAAIKTRSLQPVCLARYIHPSKGHVDEGELIYTGSLGKTVLGVKFFSYSSSMFSLCVMPYILLKTGIGTNSLALQVIFCSFVGVFTFLTPILLHTLTKGYVVRLYHNANTDTYTAITYNVLLKEKMTVFHQREVKVPEIHRMFTTFFAGKTGLLVSPDLFPIPHDYNHLMGYDKPFHFDEEDLDERDKQR